MKQQKKEMLRQVPWIGVGAILLAGVLISVGIVCFRQNTTAENATGSETEAVHTLVFLDEEGAVLDEQQVSDGGYAMPPELESVNDSIAFRCWNQSLYRISRSTELTPVYQDLRESENAFYMDAHYVELGRNVELELWLGGEVCLSSIELTLTYDPEVLLDFQCDVEGSPFRVVSSEEGSVTLRLDADENLAEALTVATLRGTVSKARTDLIKTQIHVDMSGPKLLLNGTEKGTDSNAVHGDIYVLS